MNKGNTKSIIQSFVGGRLLKDLGSTLSLQIVARLIQLIGVFHVTRCLDSNNGESNQALAAAQYLQFILTFGLDIVAVRHLAAKSVSFNELVPSVFTLRLLIYGATSIFWCMGLFLSNLSADQNQLWLASILNFMALGMNFQWVFQGMQRMPKFSLIQALTSICIAGYFLIFFKPGISAGSDLWVMGTLQSMVTIGAWIYLKRSSNIKLINFNRIRQLFGFILEGMPNWVFGLLYNTLITFGMLSIGKLASAQKFPNHDDAYGTLARVAMATQFILAFGGSVIYTRIVVWRHERDNFFLRVNLVCFGVVLLGILCCSSFHFMHSWLFPLLLPNPIYQPGAPYLSLIIFGRFLGLASGILVWSLLAYRKDWDAVKCALLPVLVTVGLHFYWVPLHGLKAVVYLYFCGELMLFSFCLVAFMYLKREVTLKTS